MIQVAAIIPTVYSSDFTRLAQAVHAVESAVREVRGVKLSIVVVYNSVQEGIQEVFIKNRLKRLSVLPIVVIINQINKGYAQAVNDGILYARALGKPDWHLVLNDDALLHKEFFVQLLSHIASGAYDAVSCGIQTPSGTIESIGLGYYSTGLAFPRHKAMVSNDREIFTGTCVLLSKRRVEKELSRQGHIFNPLFFAYAEDLELSLRILRDGGKIYISSDVLVTHSGSQTAKRGSFFQLYHGYRNLVLITCLLWSWQTVVFRLPLLLVGHAYIFGMSIYKGYWLLYPKIWWWIGKNWKIILWQRRSYVTR